MLDVKKTSWKKLSKLLSVHEKKGLLSQKLVRVCQRRGSMAASVPRFVSGLVGAGGPSRRWETASVQVHKQDHIAAVNRGHNLYTEFAPTEQPMAAAQPVSSPAPLPVVHCVMIVGWFFEAQAVSIVHRCRPPQW